MDGCGYWDGLDLMKEQSRIEGWRVPSRVLEGDRVCH
jgi:hypothetical protein